MRILIDGHNLIGQMTGISLADPDDEAQLVALLRRYADRTGHKLTVIFDGGLPGGPSRELSRGGVTVVFAPTGQPADPHIIRRLLQMRDKSGWLLITSDQAIIRAAGRQRVPVKRSDVFASELSEADRMGGTTPPPDPRQTVLSEDEVDAWLQEFANRPNPLT